jgi:hypothetical protein
LITLLSPLILGEDKTSYLSNKFKVNYSNQPYLEEKSFEITLVAKRLDAKKEPELIKRDIKINFVKRPIFKPAKGETSVRYVKVDSKGLATVKFS